MGDTVTCKLVNVSIERGRDTITVEVPKHEIDVLRAVHGPSNVVEGDLSGETLELSDSADAEYQRMQNKYRRANAADPVRVAYPVGPRSLEEFGFALGRGAREDAPQSGVRTHAKAQEPAAKEKPAAK
ncbi:hypothetical protein EAH88_11850 [Rhodanobacter glycinis]|uniref:Uncharacterized protein n=1 Tax=Rhodanobacter glycinis TaxID=582702 RepID=A0A502C5Y4_9GAMM|nr:hypothetical protein [Rhodanobacter glycinis]TPG08318.1 hypothetical protein EAH88_11850 [Rhodanobacter glycinis]